MQIYGYPAERVDFVSKSGSAGSILFGDPRSLVEEFFGTPHTDDGETISYFNGSIAIGCTDGKVASITITPGTTREKVDVFLRRHKLNAATSEELSQLLVDDPEPTAAAHVAARFSAQLDSVTFS